MSVTIDSGELPMLSSIDIDNQPERSRVINAWIIAMGDFDQAAKSMAPILREIEQYRAWELYHYGDMKRMLEIVGITQAAETIDGLPQLLADYIDKADRGEDTGLQINKIEHLTALRDGPGGDTRSAEFRKNHCDNVTKETHGSNSQTYTIRRLLRDDPALAQRVINGELSANAAAIQAGFRERTVSIKLNPESAAKTITKHFSNDDIADLIKRLEMAVEALSA